MLMQNNKAFSIIELLVVIAIFAIMAVFGYPKVDDWVTEREAKKNAFEVKEYLEKIRDNVNAGKYPFAIVHFVPNPALWTMTQEEWSIQMRVPADSRTHHSNSAPKSFLNTPKTYSDGTSDRLCPGSFNGFILEDKMRMSKNTSDAFSWPSDLNWSPNVHVCLSKNAFFTPYGNGGETFPGLSGKALFLLCSNKNTNRSGSNRCHWVQSPNKKLKYLYAIRINRNLDVEVLKFNEKNTSWIVQN